jgi:hypothetical protein
MARVSGRSLWIAWPAGVICAAVVGALLWLAAPGVPGAIDFIGNTLRTATSAPVADGEAEDVPVADPATDCRGLYPDRLWAELTWTPEALLSQSTAPPASASSLFTALSPEVRLTCSWRADGGRSVSTTVATVAADAASVVQAALTAEGFTCAVDGAAVHCERTQGSVAEVHDLRGDVWVSSVLTDWLPEDYAAQVASRAF